MICSLDPKYNSWRKYNSSQYYCRFIANLFKRNQDSKEE